MFKTTILTVNLTRQIKIKMNYFSYLEALIFKKQSQHNY